MPTERPNAETSAATRTGETDDSEDPDNSCKRHLPNLESLCGGQVFVSLSVRSDPRGIFEAAREDTGSEEGTLFQGTYTYDADQVAEVVTRTVPLEDFGNEEYEILNKVEVRITDPE